MPSAAMTRAAFVDRVTPTARPPVHCVQARANAAMVCVLPEPAGATRTDTAVCVARSPAATSTWAESRSDRASTSSAWAGVTSWGTLRAASRTRYSSRSRWAGVVYRSAPGGVYTLRPSDAGPRASTAPEDTASAASSSARAAWSTPGAMAGMAR